MALPEKDKEIIELEQAETKANKELLLTIEPERQREIVEMVLQDIKNEEQNRSEWSSIRADYMKLLKGQRDAKSIPWEGCSNITTMATATHTKLIHSKLFPLAWNEQLIYWKPQEKADIENVDKIQKFMGWVVRQEMKLQDVADRLVQDLVQDGEVVRKVRWEVKYKWLMDETGPVYKCFEKAVVDEIDLEDFYFASDDIQNCDFVAQNIYYTLPDLKELANRGIYENVSDTLEPKMIDEYFPEGKRIKMSDDQIAVADAEMRNYPIRVIEWYGKYDIDGDGTREECVFWVGYKSKTFLGGKLLTSISKIGERPFVKGPLMKLGDRKVGIGIPELMRGLAAELDAVHNQRIDAGNIAIAPFFFFRSGSSLKPDEIRVGPGVGVPVDDVNDVKLAQFPTSNLAVSFQEERIIIEFIEKLTNASSYQMGRESDVVKSRATASGTLAIISQGEQAFSILGIRCQGVMSRLLSMILHFYQQFMPPGLAERVLNEDAGDMLFANGLSPEDIIGNYDAYMVLDSTAGNKAMARETAMAMMQTLLPITQDPSLRWQLMADFVTSMGKVDPEKYIGPKPPSAQQQQAQLAQSGGMNGLSQQGFAAQQGPAGGGVGGPTPPQGMGPAEEMGPPEGQVPPQGGQEVA